jgi:hypothetical protein
LIRTGVRFGCLGTEWSCDLPANLHRARQGRAKIDANTAALFGAIELEGQLIAVLDLTSEEHPECRAVD